jgi:TetR/AcrR family transcriptional regulator, regulator of autoinduction and epiphytic fitness
VRNDYTAGVSAVKSSSRKTVAPKEARVDGRRLRTERTRAAILRALLELVHGGVVTPTAPQIAAKAGVALRSIAQHFPSREALFAAAAAAYRDLAPRTGEVDPSLPLDERIEAFAARRAEVLETIMAAQSPAVHEGLRAAARLRRHEVAAVFAPELDRHARGARADLLDVLDAAASGRTWDALRDDMQLAVKSAQARMAFLIRAVLR